MVRFKLIAVGGPNPQDQIDIWIKGEGRGYNPIGVQTIAEQPLNFEMSDDIGVVNYLTPEESGFRIVKQSSEVKFADGQTYYYIYPLNTVVSHTTLIVGGGVAAAVVLSSTFFKKKGGSSKKR